MSYTALYRKWRPAEFPHVKGQDHIVTTLKNQIKAGRIGHAYLFCGTRGTGKTSVAKIFAKAVNCEHPVDGSPCNECDICKSIGKGTSMNVIEIDAASNNGVDNIREIRDEVSYSPTEGKYKVYIIDEVHMLSIGAFNALLKTLEEPPPYVIFILATTEVHKIPITILSRCQRYDFRRITIEIIADRLKELVEEEDVKVEEKAIKYIAKAADGSMRDALSLLDQCIAFYIGKKLTYENTLEVLGAVDTEVFSKLLRGVINKDVIGCIHNIEEMIMLGRELSQFVTDFTWYMRNLLLAKTSDNIEEVIDVSAENLIRLKEEAEMISEDALIRYIRIFSELSNQIKYSSQKRVLIEIAIIKLCKPQMEKNVESILQRIESIEERLEEGVFTSASKVQAESVASPNLVTKNKELLKLPKAIPEDIKEVVTNWRGILNEITDPVKTLLKSAKLSLGGENRLQIIIEEEINESFLNTKAHIEELEETISRRIGKEIEIEVKRLERGRKFEDNYVDIEKMINMEITIED